MPVLNSVATIEKKSKDFLRKLWWLGIGTRQNCKGKNK